MHAHRVLHTVAIGSPFADLNKVARFAPQAFSLDPAVVTARWATLKQTLGWDDRQCKEVIAKNPQILHSSYTNQYVLFMVQEARCRDRPRPVGINPRHGAAVTSG
jgi:hypothetical protein